MWRHCHPDVRLLAEALSEEKVRRAALAQLQIRRRSDGGGDILVDVARPDLESWIVGPSIPTGTDPDIHNDEWTCFVLCTPQHLLKAVKRALQKEPDAIFCTLTIVGHPLIPHLRVNNQVVQGGPVAILDEEPLNVEPIQERGIAAG